MKKIVIAVAVLGAFAGVAQAQSNVTIYGVADANLRFDKTNIGTLNSVGSGGASGSRWGLRGSEDLGGGLKANFVFEQGFDLSSNDVAQGNIGGVTPTSPVSSTGSRLFSRTAYVGLSGNFGNVRFGREYTPYFNTWANADPFGTGMVGQLGQTSLLGSTTRFDNGIYYDTPKFSGFTGSVAYRMGESTTDSTVAGSAAKNGGNAYHLAVNYSNGPIYAGYAYSNTKNATATAATKASTLAGVYDFGVAKLHGLYWNVKNDTSPATVNAQSYALGVTVPVGAWTFLAGYTHIDDRSAANLDANFYGLGALYAFSKRTDIYSSYGKMNNKNGASYEVGDASNNGLQTAANVPANYAPSSLQIGLRHRF